MLKNYALPPPLSPYPHLVQITDWRQTRRQRHVPDDGRASIPGVPYCGHSPARIMLWRGPRRHFSSSLGTRRRIGISCETAAGE